MWLPALLGALALLPALFAYVQAEKWTKFDLNEESRYVRGKPEDGVSVPGAKYSYTKEKCTFDFPTVMVRPAEKSKFRPVSLQGAYSMAAIAASTLRAVVFEIAANDAGRTEPRKPALLQVAHAIAGESVDPIAKMLNDVRAEFHLPMTLYAQEQGKRTEYALSAIGANLATCYGSASVVALKERVSCLEVLKQHLRKVASLPPRDKATVAGYSHVFPLVMMNQVLHAAVAADYSKALFPYLTSEERYRHQKKVEDLQTDLNNLSELLGGTVSSFVYDLFPYPLTNDPETVRSMRKQGFVENTFHHKRIETIKEIAAAAARGDVHDPTTPLSSIHELPVSLDDAKNMELKPSLSAYYREKSTRGPMAAFLCGSKTVTSLARYPLSRLGAECTVHGRHVCSRAKSARRSGGAGGSGSGSGSWSKSAGDYACRPQQVRVATYRVMQALVEKYYAQGAVWTDTHVFKVEEDVKQAFSMLNFVLTRALDV